MKRLYCLRGVLATFLALALLLNGLLIVSLGQRPAWAYPESFSDGNPYFDRDSATVLNNVIYEDYGPQGTPVGNFPQITNANGIDLIQPNPATPDVVYMGYRGGDMFRLRFSTNGGQTWSNPNTGTDFGVNGDFDLVYRDDAGLTNSLVLVYSHSGLLYWRVFAINSGTWGANNNLLWNDGSHAQGVRPQACVDGTRVHVSYLYTNSLCYTSLDNHLRGKIISGSADSSDWQSMVTRGTSGNLSIFYKSGVDINEAWSGDNGETFFINGNWDGRTEECYMPSAARQFTSGVTDTMAFFYTWRDSLSQWRLSSRAYNAGTWGGVQTWETRSVGVCSVPVQSGATICVSGTDTLLRLIHTMGTGEPTLREFTFTSGGHLTNITQTTNAYHWGHQEMTYVWNAYIAQANTRSYYTLAVAEGSTRYGPPPPLRTYYGACLEGTNDGAAGRRLCFTRTLWEAPNQGTNECIISANDSTGGYYAHLVDNRHLYVNANSTTWNYTQAVEDALDQNWDMTGYNGTSITGGSGNGFSWGNYLRGISNVGACYQKHYPSGNYINVKFPNDIYDGNPGDTITSVVNEAGNTGGTGDYSISFRGSSSMALPQGVYRTKLLCFGMGSAPEGMPYAGIPAMDMFGWVYADGTPPTVATAITGTPGNNGWYRNITGVQLSAADPAIYSTAWGGFTDPTLEHNVAGSGIRRIYYRIRANGAAWPATYTAVASSSVTVPGGTFVDGENQIEYYAQDNVGNVTAPQVLTINCDSTAPTVTPGRTPATPDGTSGWYLTSPSAQLPAADPTPGSGLYRVFHRHRLNDGAWSGWAASTTLPVTLAYPSGGYHVVESYAEDLAGNTGALTTVSWQYDEKKPVYDKHPAAGTVESSEPAETPNPADSYISPASPDGNNGWWRTNPSVHLNIEDDASGFRDDTGFNHPFYRLYNEAAATTTTVSMPLLNPWLWASGEYHLATADFSLPGEGIWSLSWFGNALGAYTDIAGRALTPPSGGSFLGLSDITWNGTPYANVLPFDATPPAQSQAITPTLPDGANGWYVTRPTVGVTGSDILSGYDRTEYRWNAGAIATTTDNPATLQPPSPGVNTLEYWVYDVAGNSAGPYVTVVQWDPDAPSVAHMTTPATPNGDNGWFVGARPGIDLTATGGPSGFAYWEYHWNADGAQVSTDNPLGAQPPSNGVHTLYYTAYAGNGLSTSGQLTVRWDNVSPVISGLPQLYPEEEWATWFAPLVVGHAPWATLDINGQVPWLRDYAQYEAVVGGVDATSGMWSVDFAIWDDAIGDYASWGQDYTPEAGGIFRSPQLSPTDFRGAGGAGIYMVGLQDQAGNTNTASPQYVLDLTPPQHVHHAVQDVTWNSITLADMVFDGTWPTGLWSPRTLGTRAWCERVVLEWGTSTAYGNTVELSHSGEAYNGSTYAAQVWASHTLDGLLPSTPYHFRFRVFDLAHNEAVSADFTATTEDYLATQLETWDVDGTHHADGASVSFGKLERGKAVENSNPAVRLTVTSSVPYQSTVLALGEFSNSSGHTIPWEAFLWRGHPAGEWALFGTDPQGCATGTGDYQNPQAHEYDLRISAPGNQALGVYQVPVRYVTYQR